MSNLSPDVPPRERGHFDGPLQVVEPPVIRHLYPGFDLLCWVLAFVVLAASPALLIALWGAAL